jgi:hypothetical protein
MERDNAKRIHDFSNGKSTKITIDGSANPVQCEPTQRCAPSTGAGGGGSGGAGAVGGSGTGAPEALADREVSATPGLEGKFS